MYELDFRCKWLGDGCTSLEEIAARLEETAAELREMAKDGVQMENEMQDDYAFLKTDDITVAIRYGFRAIEIVEEEEEWEEIEEEEWEA
jgi:hypothetical protein